MTFKLYSRLKRNNELVYEFELNSHVGNYDTYTITGLIDYIIEDERLIYKGKQTIYEYFSTCPETLSITFLVECEFIDVDDMRCNLKSVLYNKYPELFL